MNKNRFLYRTGLITCSSFLVFQQASCNQLKEKKQVLPNIILINIDDLGWVDVGYNGSTFYETPNIDNLYAKALCFRHAYAAAANSAPSRACLMTGLMSKQWPLRAGKGSFYEGGIRVPFLVYMKGRYEGGKTINTPISQIDLFPTYMALIQEDYTKDLHLDGESLLPLLENPQNEKYLSDRPLYWHFPAYLEEGNSESKDTIFRTRPVSVIRQGDWKLIENYEDNSLELYNIQEDPSEKQNLCETNPVKKNRLYDSLNKWKRQTRALLPVAKND